MKHLIQVIVQSWSYPILIGLILASGALRGADTITVIALVIIAVVAAISYQGEFFERLSWVVMSFFAMAAVSWLEPVFGIITAFVATLALRGLGLRLWKNAALAGGAFLVFANTLVFSIALFELEPLVMLIGVLSLWIIIGAGIPKHPDGHLAVFVLLLIQSAMIMLLQFLPFGYLTIAAIGAAWHFVLLSLSVAHLEGKLERKKVIFEILMAAILTLLAVLFSGIRPR